MKAPTSAGVRTGTMFVVGIGGIIWQTVVDSTDRPALLVLFAMLLGFPLVLNLDNVLRAALPLPTAAVPVPPPPADPVKEAAP